MFKTGSVDSKILPVTFVLVAALLLPHLAKAGAEEKDDLARGSALFAQSCQQCHPGGSNVVNPSKPVKGSDTLVSLATFKQYLQQPVGDMPFEAHIVNDEDNLKAIYAYCKSL